MTTFSDNARWVETTPWPKRIAVAAGLIAMDIGFNAAAGAAAVAAAVQHNGGLPTATTTTTSSPTLAALIGLGALAGTIKAGILAVPVAASRLGGLSAGMTILMMLIFNSFGICVLLTTAVWQRAQAMGILDYGAAADANTDDAATTDVPRPLLLAALVTALPLVFEMVVPVALPTAYLASLGLIGWDALAGFTFAAMTAHFGQPVVAVWATAAVAGAVYGTLTAVRGFIVAGLKSCTTVQKFSNGKAHVDNLLGSWEVFDPTPPRPAFSSIDF
ncbi:hypothetical protein HK405_005821 [Cladochytrium tenue]|nr:hypothetical protein HK405_005821 [Cladochytrium tenue]